MIFPNPELTRAALERIIERFPFDEVREHMRSMQWRWAVVATPNAEQMATMLRELLASVFDRKATNPVSSGGFAVGIGANFVEVVFRGKTSRTSLKKDGPRWATTEKI